MNESKNLHHFLNMSRSIHENVIATKVNGTEITKNIGHIESKYAEIIGAGVESLFKAYHQYIDEKGYR